jgi:hypothetical protein
MTRDTESAIPGWRACAWAAGALLLVAVGWNGDGARADEPAAGVRAPAPVAAGPESPAPAQTVVFRAAASALPKDAEVVQGKGPNDPVEIVLPGRVYTPPLKLEPVQTRSQADRRTPEQASASDFSAFRAGDPEWFKENFTSEDYPSIKRLIEEPGVRKQNQNMFMRYGAKVVVATCMYKEHALVFVQYDGAKAGGIVEAYRKVGAAWQRTNALSKDPTLTVLLQMFRNGDIAQVGQ